MSAFEGKDKQFDSWCEYENKKRLENKIKELEQQNKRMIECLILIYTEHDPIYYPAILARECVESVTGKDIEEIIT